MSVFCDEYAAIIQNLSLFIIFLQQAGQTSKRKINCL